MRIISESDRRVDITGLNNHQIKSIPIVTAGGVIKTNRGEVILILNQCAGVGEGKTIHSAGQMEMFQNKVDDVSMAAGGTQTVTTLEGYVIPLDVEAGLPHIPIRRYTDKEFETLPHVHLTENKPWDPSILDRKLSDDPKWYKKHAKDASILDDPSNPFDEKGELKWGDPERETMEGHNPLAIKSTEVFSVNTEMFSIERAREILQDELDDEDDVSSDGSMPSLLPPTGRDRDDDDSSTSSATSSIPELLPPPASTAPLTEEDDEDVTGWDDNDSIESDFTVSIMFDDEVFKVDGKELGERLEEILEQHKNQRQEFLEQAHLVHEQMKDVFYDAVEGPPEMAESLSDGAEDDSIEFYDTIEAYPTTRSKSYKKEFQVMDVPQGTDLEKMLLGAMMGSDGATKEDTNAQSQDKQTSKVPKVQAGKPEIKEAKRDYESLKRFFLGKSADIIKRTYEATTQFVEKFPIPGTHIRQSKKSHFPALNVERRNEKVATDTRRRNPVVAACHGAEGEDVALDLQLAGEAAVRNSPHGVRVSPAS